MDPGTGALQGQGPRPGARLPVGTFGGLSALPLLVAQQEGMLARAGLEVERVLMADSRALRDGLRHGQLAIVHAAPDNAIAWTDGTGEPMLAWLAGSNGPITLVARGARSVTDLRARRVAVDAPDSGFAPILRRLLAAGGLGDADVDLVALGATRLRFEALMDGRVDASMLTLPWSRLATRHGLVAIADHATVTDCLVTSAAISRADWLDGERATAEAYGRALGAALAWLHDPTETDAAVRILAHDMDLDPGTAKDVLSVMRDRRVGWPPRPDLPASALVPTWRLRSETHGPPRWAPDAYVRPWPRSEATGRAAIEWSSDG